MKPTYKTYTGATCLPEPIVMSGTITSVGNTVFISGGLELFSAGEFIYNPGTNEVRKITKILNESTVEIDEAFTDDIETPVDFRITGRDRFKKLALYVIGATSGTYMGYTFPSGIVVDLEDFDNGIDPVVINATGTTIAVSSGF